MSTSTEIDPVIKGFYCTIVRTVWCHYNTEQYYMILHASLQLLRQDINQNVNPQKSPFISLLTDVLWGVFCEDFGENWSCYNGATLYFRNGLAITSDVGVLRFFPFQEGHHIGLPNPVARPASWPKNPSTWTKTCQLGNGSDGKTAKNIIVIISRWVLINDERTFVSPPSKTNKAFFWITAKLKNTIKTLI